MCQEFFGCRLGLLLGLSGVNLEFRRSLLDNDPGQSAFNSGYTTPGTSVLSATNKEASRTPTKSEKSLQTGLRSRVSHSTLMRGVWFDDLPKLIANSRTASSLAGICAA
ncbi:hypothetical protein SRHO_G00220990 [Serrasalmus rhombeus]